MKNPSDFGARAPAPVEEKFNLLLGNVAPLVREGLVVAFSGGVDSAFLLWAAQRVAQERGGRVVALTTVSASTPAREKKDAREFAEKIGAAHFWFESAEMSNAAYVRNDENRCYECKSELFRVVKSEIEKLECRYIAYGFTASDRSDFRPGRKAAMENDVFAPLDEAGLEKEEIRILMRAHGLDLAEKPASPCLSSRLVRGVEVTAPRLRAVDAMEEALRACGVRVARVRLHSDGGADWARVEVGQEDLETALRSREILLRQGRERGLRWVLLDLAGYKMGGANS